MYKHEYYEDELFCDYNPIPDEDYYDEICHTIKSIKEILKDFDLFFEESCNKELLINKLNKFEKIKKELEGEIK